MRVDPASQGLHATELARQRADDRLVVDLDPMVFNGFIEMADDVVADVTVHGNTRQGNVDLLHRAVVDRPICLCVDKTARDIRIADAARAREEMPLDMVETAMLLCQLMLDVVLDANAVIHCKEVLRHAFCMAAELLLIETVKQLQHFIIDIEEAMRRLCLDDVEAAGQILDDTRKLAQVVLILIHFHDGFTI